MRPEIVDEAQDEFPASDYYSDLLGRIYFDLGNFVESEKTLRECLEIKNKNNSQDWSKHSVQLFLGASMLKLENISDAEIYITLGYDGLRKLKLSIPESIRNKRLESSASWMANLFRKKGDSEAAKKYEEEAASFQ